MNINNTTDLLNSKVNLESNSPVKMPSAFGGIMQKYYNKKIREAIQDLNNARDEFDATSNLLNSVNDEQVKEELVQAQVNANTRIEKASEKIAKYYDKYEGIDNKVNGFNKSKLGKDLAVELHNPSSVAVANEVNSEIPTVDAVTPISIEQSEVEVQPVTNSAINETEVGATPVSDVNVQENVVPTEEKQVSNKVEEFTSYVLGLEKDNKELKELLEESKNTIDNQKTEIDNLKQELENVKKQLENMNMQPSVEVQPQPVQPNVAQPSFMQYTSRINQSNSKEQLNSIKYELNTQRNNLNLTDIQFNVLMGNIDNALKRYDVQPNPINDISFAQPSVNDNSFVQPTVVQPNSVINQPTNPFIKPVQAPNFYLDYNNKVADAVNKSSINELVQLQYEINFNKDKFTEEQYSGLIKSINDGIKSINPATYSL